MRILLGCTLISVLLAIHLQTIVVCAAEDTHSEESHKHRDQASSDGKSNHGANEEGHTDGQHAHSDEHGHEENGGHGHGDEHGHHDEEEPSAAVGKDKAITAASKDQGIQLSSKSIQVMGIKTMTLPPGGPRFQVPEGSVVAYQAERGVYRLRNGWFKLVPVQLVSKSGGKATIASTQLAAGDEIAVQNVPFLRTAELEAWGGSGDGHGH